MFFTLCVLIPFIPRPFACALCPCTILKRTKFKKKYKENKKRFFYFLEKKRKELQISSQKLQCDATRHALYPFVHTSLLASVPCRVIGLVGSLLSPLQGQFWSLTLSVGQAPLCALTDHRWGGFWDRSSHSPENVFMGFSRIVGCMFLKKKKADNYLTLLWTLH